MSIKQHWSNPATIPSRLVRGYPPATNYIEPRTSYWLKLLWIMLGGGLGTLVVILALLIAILVSFYQSDVVIPGVQTFGIYIGGLSTDEAITRLQQKWWQQTITLKAGDITLTVAPELLGISLDTEATIQAAYRQGRSVVMLQEWLWSGGHVNIAPVWRLDIETAETNLDELTSQLDTPPVDASIRLIDDRVEAVPYVMGQTLNLPATVAELRQKMAKMVSGGELELVMSPVQPNIMDVSDAVEQANQLLGHTVTIQAHDPVADETIIWTIDRQVWAKWVSFDLTPNNAPKLIWDLKPELVKEFLETQSATLGENRYIEIDTAVEKITNGLTDQQTTTLVIRLRIYHHPQLYSVQYGETVSSIAYKHGFPYPWIQEVNPGLGDNVLSVGQVINIPSPDVMLPLPVVENKRIVISISEQKMWVYEDGVEKWVWEASTGIDSSPTSPGIFQIQSRQETAYATNWNLWMPHFMGIYRPAPYADFMNGIHGFPSRNGSQLLWTNNLGHPVTYGCILVSSENAEILYEWAEDGVIVEIQG
jgi:lipoprotein-anchoring transpeptidase ErfK/SrfK